MLASWSMGRDQGRRDGRGAELEQQQARIPEPGRRTLAMGRGGGPAVQRKATEPGKRPLSQGAGPRARGDESIEAVAARGVAGTASPLPYRDVIQRSFGRHDVSQISAHVGGAATGATADIGAQAYATGTSVAFASAPDLHTAAHEAAHVVQQRGGVQLVGGVGEAGDVYERHADQVADAVVAGASAEALLDRHAGARGAPAPTASGQVQRKLAVQAETAAGRITVLNFSGRSDSPFTGTMGSHSTAWLVHCDHLRARLIGRPPVEALAVLEVLGGELEKLPTAPLLDAMDATDLKNLFDTEHGALTTKLAAAKVRMRSTNPLTDDEAVSLVQECAAAYLSARNYLPGATVNTTKPDGRYESGHRAVLVGHEKKQAVKGAADLRTAFLGLFDLSALAALGRLPDDKRGDAGPGVGAPTPARLGMLLGQHLIEARDTYPQAFARAAFTESTLAPLLAHTAPAAIAEAALEVLAGHAADTGPRSATFEGTQAIAAQIVLSADGTAITDIRAGRAPSPFNNTMGAHTTAWVIHEDALRTAIVGKPPDAALASLLQMAVGVESMPTFQWVPNLGPKVGPQFQVAHDQLKVLIAEGRKAKGTSSVGILQRLAQQLLVVLNLLPAATIDLDSQRSGNGETSIDAMRRDGGTDFEISRQLWTNLDVAALRKLFDEVLEHDLAAEDARAMREGQYNDGSWHNQHDHGAFWDLRAPGVGTSDSEERLAVVLSQHRYAVDHAYPWIRSEKKQWRQAYASIHTAAGIMAELNADYPQMVCAKVVTRMHAIRPFDQFDAAALLVPPRSTKKSTQAPIKNLTKKGNPKRRKNDDDEKWGM